MNRPLSLRERRLLALGLLLLVCLASYQLVLGPFVAGFAARAEQRKQLSLQAAHNDRTIASTMHLRRQARQRRAALTQYALIMPNPLAVRTLGQRLQATIGDMGGTVSAIEPSQVPDGWVGARNWPHDACSSSTGSSAASERSTANDYSIRRHRQILARPTEPRKPDGGHPCRHASDLGPVAVAANACLRRW